jgi:hypothetical protein
VSNSNHHTLQVKKLSVKRITSPLTYDSFNSIIPEGLYDPAMGPADINGRCDTTTTSSSSSSSNNKRTSSTNKRTRSSNLHQQLSQGAMTSPSGSSATHMHAAARLDA